MLINYFLPLLIWLFKLPISAVLGVKLFINHVINHLLTHGDPSLQVCLGFSFFGLGLLCRLMSLDMGTTIILQYIQIEFPGWIPPPDIIDQALKWSPLDLRDSSSNSLQWLTLGVYKLLTDHPALALPGIQFIWLKLLCNLICKGASVQTGKWFQAWIPPSPLNDLLIPLWSDHHLALVVILLYYFFSWDWV